MSTENILKEEKGNGCLADVMACIFYEKNGVKYYIGDKVIGEFADGDDAKYGVVKFGLFNAYWPTGAHEIAEAYGFYVKTENHKDGYAINRIKGLSKYLP